MKLSRYPYYDTHDGHTRGHWLVAGHPLSLTRDSRGRWWIAIASAAGYPQTQVRQYQHWGMQLGLLNRFFERRSDALAWVAAALSADPPRRS